MCAQIAQADLRLAGLIDSSRIVTQEIREALMQTDRVRSECRLKMLEHFYEMTAAMPEEGRGKYLGMVLPVVLDPGRMAEAHEID